MSVNRILNRFIGQRQFLSEVHAVAIVALETCGYHLEYHLEYVILRIYIKTTKQHQWAFNLLFTHTKSELNDIMMS